MALEEGNKSTKTVFIEENKKRFSRYSSKKITAVLILIGFIIMGSLIYIVSIRDVGNTQEIYDVSTGSSTWDEEKTQEVIKQQVEQSGIKDVGSDIIETNSGYDGNVE